MGSTSSAVRTALSMSSLQLLLLVSITISGASALSANGVWSPSSDFVKVVARFGFLKSDVHHKDVTDGYIFGNVTSAFRKEEKRKATLLLVDRSTFAKIYGKKEPDSSSLTCDKIFSVINEVAYDEKCNDAKERDITRYVPCPRDEVRRKELMALNFRD